MRKKIDKSLFNADELAQYEALIAKATVDPEGAEEEMEEEKPPFVPEKKKTEKAEVETMEKAAPEITAALQRLETLEKSLEMKEFAEIAKKYAPLGEKEEDLAKTLYDMKKSNEANYNAYIAILDKSLGLVEKSGYFTEIGKSRSGGGSVEARIQAAASEIQKADPNMSRETAVMKAWENNPEWIAEYESTY